MNQWSLVDISTPRTNLSFLLKQAIMLDFVSPTRNEAQSQSNLDKHAVKLVGMEVTYILWSFHLQITKTFSLQIRTQVLDRAVLTLQTVLPACKCTMMLMKHTWQMFTSERHRKRSELFSTLVPPILGFLMLRSKESMDKLTMIRPQVHQPAQSKLQPSLLLKEC